MEGKKEVGNKEGRSQGHRMGLKNEFNLKRDCPRKSQQESRFEDGL